MTVRYRGVYSWVYRHLPGPTSVRVATAVALVLGVAALLMFVVFPQIQPWVDSFFEPEVAITGNG